MAFRFCDSYDHYTTGQVLRKWTAGSINSISTGNGRSSTNCLRLATFDYVSLTLDSQSTWIIGTAYKTSSTALGTLGGTAQNIELLDAGSTQIGARLNSDGTFSVVRGGTVLGTTSFSILANTYYFLELKVVIHPSSGSFDLRINGVSRVSASGVNTRSTSNSTANQIKLAGSNAVTNDFDDTYILDGTGSANNDFIGDVRIQALLPSGNGNYSQFVGSDGNSTNNYLLVSETTPDDDTSYVESSSVGDKDTYAFSNLSGSPGTVFAIQTVICGRKTDAGSRSIARVIRSGSTDEDGATVALPDNYVYLLQASELDPNTSAAWTPSGVNNAEFGFKNAA